MTDWRNRLTGIWNKYGYTNFHELNVDYFITVFAEIFTEWESLYNDLTSWKTETVNELNALEANLINELEEWKASTQISISEWENEVLTELNAWKTAATTAFEAIRTEAAASATSAASSATAAETSATAAAASATAAAASAGSVSESVTQIATNTSDITDLKANRISMKYSDAESLSNVDLDNYTTPGEYRVTSTNAATITHGPVTNLNYRLIVLTTASSTLPIQIAVISSSARNTKLMMRNKTSGGWQDWLKMMCNYDIQSYVTPPTTTFSVGDIPRRSYTLIGDATKLNSLPSDWPSGVSLFISRSNINEAGNISLMTISTGSASNTEQATYIGVYNESGSAFSGWTKLATGSEIATLTSALTTLNAKVPDNLFLGGGVVDFTNYLTIFPNAKYADARENSIYRISTPTLPITDAPPGNTRILEPNGNTGGMVGTLITISAAAVIPGNLSGVVQIFVADRTDDTSPICWRIGSWSAGVLVYKPWAKFVQNGYLRSSNIIENGGSLIFDDMNDMPNNTIVQIDLNVDGSDAAHTLAHHPCPGVSSVAMCYAYSYSSDHGKVQTVFNINGGFYWRYGYYQSANDYRWTDWFEINNKSKSITREGIIPQNGDLNTLTTESIWYISSVSSYNYQNNPLTGGGFLTVHKYGSVSLQIAEDLTGNRYTRYTSNSGTSWSTWA